MACVAAVVVVDPQYRTAAMPACARGAPTGPCTPKCRMAHAARRVVASV